MDEELVQVPNNTFGQKTIKVVEFVHRMFCLSSLDIILQRYIAITSTRIAPNCTTVQIVIVKKHQYWALTATDRLSENSCKTYCTA